jgi:hypothetical protein
LLPIRRWSEGASCSPSSSAKTVVYSPISQDYVTELDLSRLALPSSALHFLKKHMPSTVVSKADLPELEDDGSGANGHSAEGETTILDYTEFLNQFME